MYTDTQNSFIPIIYLIASVNIIFAPFIMGWNGLVDELAVLFLLMIGLPQILNSQRSKEFYVILGILSFYLLYSLLFGKNIYKAVVLDFILFLKPFISFFIPLLIPFRITEQAKNAIKKFYFACGVFCTLQLPFINSIYPNTAAYY